MKSNHSATDPKRFSKGKKSKKLTRHPLPDDPRKALLQVSKFLNSVVIKKRRRFPAEADNNHFKGFWQSISWVYRATELAYEAERVANLL